MLPGHDSRTIMPHKSTGATIQLMNTDKKTVSKSLLNNCKSVQYGNMTRFLPRNIF